MPYTTVTATDPVTGQERTALATVPETPRPRPYIYGASNPALRPVVPAGE